MKSQTIAEFRAELTKDESVAMKPFILKDIASVATLLQGEVEGDTPLAKMSQSVPRWQSKFPDMDLCKQNDRLSAPMYAAHGDTAAQTLLKTDIIAACGLKEYVCPDLPSLQRTFNTPWFWGFLPTLLLFGTEPDQLGSCRLVLEGELQVLAVDPTQMIGVLGLNGPAPRGATTQMLAHMKKLTAVQLQEMAKAGRFIFNGVVTAGQALIIPPGWLVALTPIRGTASGMRCSWLPKLLSEAHRADQLSLLTLVQQTLDEKDLKATMLNTVMEFLTTEHDNVVRCSPMKKLKTDADA